MPDLAKQNYELAFHISSNLEEADVQKTRQELERTITSSGGAVSFAKDPERIRLAYPVKRQLSSYFGYFDFNLESPESINQIRDQLRLNPTILRFLITKLEPDAKIQKQDIIRKMALSEKRKARALKGLEKPPVPKTVIPQTKEEEIEKKLEEIIEKL